MKTLFRIRLAAVPAVLVLVMTLGGGVSAVAQPAETAADSARKVKKNLYFGSLRLKAGHLETAEDYFRKAWAFSGEKKGSAAYYLGKTLKRAGEYEEAADMFVKAAELLEEGSKDLVNAYHYLGTIHSLLEHNEEAVAAYTALLALPNVDDARRVEAMQHLVRLNVIAEEYEAALVFAKTWAELEPENPDARGTVAKLALKTGATDEALAEKEKLLALNPEDWETLAWLGKQYREMGALEKSVTAYERLHAHAPKNSLYLDNLFELRQEMGAPKAEQIALLKQMHALQPNNLRVIQYLAEKTGDLSWVDKGLSRDPENGRLNTLKGEDFYNRFRANASPADSLEALVWYKKALTDPQWRDHAANMILNISPPLTKEELARRKFFGEGKKKKEEVAVKGKK